MLCSGQFFGAKSNLPIRRRRSRHDKLALAPSNGLHRLFY